MGTDSPSRNYLSVFQRLETNIFHFTIQNQINLHNCNPLIFIDTTTICKGILDNIGWEFFPNLEQKLQTVYAIFIFVLTLHPIFSCFTCFVGVYCLINNSQLSDEFQLVPAHFQEFY